ncbi:MAG: S9 family peptidase [Proteobacteria bacterium]|nr:S9 family peptidase [Pseudomonadota bacterium]
MTAWRAFKRFACLSIVAGVPVFAFAAGDGDKLNAATDAAIRTAIESPQLLGDWIFKPQYAVSRDGKRLVYLVAKPDIGTNTTHVSLWMQDLTTKAPPRLVAKLGPPTTGTRDAAHSGTTNPAQLMNPSLSPDGSKVAVVGYDGEGSIGIVDLATGEITQLHPKSGRVPAADGARYDDVAWSPAGDRIAVSFGQVVHGDENKGTDVTVDWDGSLSHQITRIAIVDLTSESIAAETPDTLDVTGFDGAFSWSPDGKVLAFSARRVTDNSYDFKWTDIFALDVLAQKVRPLVVQPGADVNPRWSPDGKSLAYNTDGGAMNWKGGMGLGLLDVATGRSRRLPLTDETGHSAYAMSWYDNTRLLFVGLRHMGCPLFVVPVDGSPARQITPDDLSCLGAGWPAGPGQFVAARHSFAEGTRLVRSPLSAWTPDPVGPDALHGLPGATERVISWKSADGRFTIHGVLITPDDGHKGPRPLLVSVNGGPSMVTPDLYDATAQQLIYPALLRGFAILAPNTRGRGGYGADFADGIRRYRDITPGPFSDIMTGVDYVVKDLGIADPQHMALMGFSYGGLLASYTVSHTDRFRAIIEGEGGGDFRDFATQSYGSIEQDGYAALFGISDPYDPTEAKVFEAQSPFAQAHDIRTPLLIECGALSLAKTECLKFFRIAHKQGHAPTEMVVYPRTGHGVFEPALRYDSAVRETAWLDRWVFGKRPE